MTYRKICVIGAGVMGLSSAVRIQDAYPGIDITVIADTFSPYTTSDGSAGYWNMFLVSQDQEEDTRRWGQATFSHILQLYNSELGGKLGAQLLSGYRFTSDMLNGGPKWKDLLLSFRNLNDKERQIHPEKKAGVFYTTVMLDVKSYLPWLMEKFRSQGGRVEFKKIESLREVSDKYDIVINCAGLRASKLFNDAGLQPIKGQVRRVYAPWIKHFIYDYNEHDGTETHILPGRDYVTVGGTATKGNWSSEPCHEDQDRLWQNAIRLCPSLKNARILADWTGLRPGRSRVRLEIEDVTTGPTVIHNYGHGGSGISLHWGCAGEVVKLFQTALLKQNITSKL